MNRKGARRIGLGVTAILCLAFASNYYIGYRHAAQCDAELVAAVDRQDVGAAKNALRHGASPNAREGSRGPVYWAKVLITYRRWPSTHNSPAISGNPILLRAIQNNDVETIRLLLNCGADPNMPDYHGMPPIAYAVNSSTDRQIIPLLIGRGATLVGNRRDGNLEEFDLFNYAAAQENMAAIRTLLSYGTAARLLGPARQWGGEAVLVASDIDPDTECDLVKAGAWVNFRGEKGETALHRAVRDRDKPVVELLLLHGADIYARDSDGNSPLSLARSAPEIAELLTRHGSEQARHDQ